MRTKHRKQPRNDDGRGDLVDEHENMLSIFKYPGRVFGKPRKRFLTDEEFKAAHTYILLNCSEVQPYIE